MSIGPHCILSYGSQTNSLSLDSLCYSYISLVLWLFPWLRRQVSGIRNLEPLSVYLLPCFIFWRLLGIRDCTGLCSAIRPNQGITAFYSRFCHSCQHFMTSAIKHCSHCNICVEGYDHHCRWISKCIGKNNLHSFYAFIGSLMVLNSYLYYVIYCIFWAHEWYVYIELLIIFHSKL